MSLDSEELIEMDDGDPDDTVYTASRGYSGRAYHDERACSRLNHATSVSSWERETAQDWGRTPCTDCVESVPERSYPGPIRPSLRDLVDSGEIDTEGATDE